MNKLRLALVTCLVAILPLTLGSCSSCAQKATQKAVEKVAEKAAEQQIEKETGQKADVKIDTSPAGGGQITVKSDQGNQVFAAGTQTQIPADFPKDIPIYQGSKPMMVVSQGAKGVFMTLQAPDSMDNLKTFYKSRMVAEGWKIDSEITLQDMVSLNCKKENRTALVNLSPGGEGKGGTVVSLSSETAAPAQPPAAPTQP